MGTQFTIVCIFFEKHIESLKLQELIMLCTTKNVGDKYASSIQRRI